MVQNGSLDIVPAMIPFLFTANVFTEYNQFALFQVIPGSPSRDVRPPACREAVDQ